MAREPADRPSLDELAVLLRGAPAATVPARRWGAAVVAGAVLAGVVAVGIVVAQPDDDPAPSTTAPAATAIEGGEVHVDDEAG